MAGKDWWSEEAVAIKAELAKKPDQAKLQELNDRVLWLEIRLIQAQMDALHKLGLWG